MKLARVLIQILIYFLFALVLFVVTDYILVNNIELLSKYIILRDLIFLIFTSVFIAFVLFKRGRINKPGNGNQKKNKEYKILNEDLEKIVNRRTFELEENIQLLRTFLDTIPNPVFIKNRKREYIEVNKAFADFFGRSKEEIIGATLEEIEAELAARITREKEENELLNKHNSLSYEINFEREGRIIHAIIYKTSFGPENQPPVGITGLLVDLTPMKNAESKIEEALNKERELNKIKTNFIAVVSHEFRSPLSSILASADYLELYRNKQSPEKVESQIKRIQSSVLKMINMLDKILLISKSEGEKIQVLTDLIDLKSFLEEIKTNMLDSLKPNQKIELNFFSDQEVVYADLFLLEHIIENLLSNAIKYSDEDSIINIKCMVSAQKIYLEIIDRGMGVSKEDLNNIFQPFYRSQKASNIKGSGLGLSIVKRFVDIYNGEITVESELNKGTTVKVSIPIIEPVRTEKKYE